MRGSPRWDCSTLPVPGPIEMGHPFGYARHPSPEKASSAMATTDGFVVVVGIDFSDTGDLALREALKLVRDRGGDSHLHVAHVVTDQDLLAADGATVMERQQDALEKLPDRIWNRIREVGSGIHGIARMQVSVHVRLGVPSRAIHQVAIDYQADVVVIGTHGRRGVPRLILGSVAESLVKIAHCPVLVAREKNYERDPLSDHPEPEQPGDAERRDSQIYTSSQVISWSPRDDGMRIY